jgi:hypothetical protein
VSGGSFLVAKLSSRIFGLLLWLASAWRITVVSAIANRVLWLDFDHGENRGVAAPMFQLQRSTVFRLCQAATAISLAENNDQKIDVAGHAVARQVRCG